MTLAMPGIIELKPPVLQPDVVPLGVLLAQAVVWGAGMVANDSSGAATQPPRAANKGSTMTAARGKLEDRSVGGMH
jgi:hypothetical protein